MGVQLSAKVGGRGGSRRLYRPMSEINVTPFVDVMLVLLIVFMVTAPLLTVSVPVNLPKTQAPPAAAVDKKPLYVSVKENGSIYVQDTPVRLTDLVATLKATPDSNPDTRIMVRGDQKNTYGLMVEVLGMIANAGFTKIGLAAELPGGTPTAPHPIPSRSNPTHH